MSQARKCDRCQCVYTGFLTGDPPDGKITTEYNISRSARAPFCCYTVDKVYDLCPACYDDFINKFMAREAFVSDE